jgi:hypothetical protein
MADCGYMNGLREPIACTRPNECCNVLTNKCGPCTNFPLENACGPCTKSDCFDLPNNYSVSFQCSKQVGEFKDCKVKKSECDGKWRTVVITRQAIASNGYNLGGVPCPTSGLEVCSDCFVSNWLPCNGTKRTRTRIITQAINGGKECTEIEKALPTEQTCNNCEVSEWSDCSNNQKIRTRTRTKEATNGGTCNYILTEPCNDCVGNWSEWSTCEANCNQFDYAFDKTKIGYRTRIYLSNINENCKIKEGGIKDGTIETDYYCTRKCNIDCSNDENCDKNFFKNIIKFFNLIILFFKKLFKL